MEFDSDWTHVKRRLGLVFPFHSLEPGASCPRREKDGPIDTIVLHYTACANLPRMLTADKTLALIERARRLRTVCNGHALEASAVARGFAVSEFNVQTNRWVPESVAQAAISCASPREAIAHYFVASIPGPLPAHPTDYFVLKGIVKPDEVVPIAETVPPTRIAHHVGPLTGNTNRRSIGIEVCYPGPAPRRECKTEQQAREWFESRGWKCPKTWSREVCLDGLPRWFAPVDPQVFDVVVGLIADLRLAFPTIRHLCSHYLFSPRSRIDPDPPLSLSLIAAEVREITGLPLDNAKPKR